MNARTKKDNIKLMVYLPPKLYKRLRLEVARQTQGVTRSMYISKALEYAMDNGFWVHANENELRTS